MTQEGKVTIVPDEMGNVIRVSKNNSDYGHVRITQNRVGFSATGWVKKQQKSTLIHGTVEDLQATGIANAKELPGCIYTREQLQPFSQEDPNRDLKVAGDTGIICKAADKNTGEILPIYRKSFYDATGQTEDILIAHVNGEEIKEANAPESTEATNTTKEEEVTEDVTNEEIVEEEVVEEELVEEDAEFTL